ncbi:MAG TPA: ADOP family duplicated permease [Vicinamibacterales bacterium]|nr:ADOP family duplicated permease [Vicinamibacterales bacterium]
MTPPALARRILRVLFPDAHRDVVVGDLDEEFEGHITRTRTPAGARRWYWTQTIRSIIPALRLRVRDGAMTVSRDTRYAARQLRRSPGFTLVVTLTLLFGVAAATAVVSVAAAVLLRPLPYAEPDRLVSIAETDTRRTSPSSGDLSLPDFRDFARLNQSFVSLAGFSGGSRTINLPDTAFRVSSVEVTEDFFRTLGVTPLLGRDFTSADMPATAPLSVILGHRTWKLRFNSDASMIGRAIVLSGTPAIVIGVLPPSFEFPLRGLAELWLPLRPSARQAASRNVHWFETIGRLRPGVTDAQAQADLAAIARGFAADDPRAHANASVEVTRLSRKIVGDSRTILLILVAAAGCLLLVACANLAGLLLSRATARRHEAGIRVALGARRAQLIQQSLLETAVLITPAMMLGLFAGGWLVRLFVAAMPLAQRAALPHLLELQVDPRAMAISAIATIAVALLFGVVPALRAAQTAGAWQQRGVVGGSRRDHRARSWLVGVEIALALILVSGAALLIVSVTKLMSVSPGFNPEGVLSFRVSLPARYTTPDAYRQFHAEALAHLSGLPAVSGSATISQLPLGGRGAEAPFLIDGDPTGVPHQALIRTVSAGYFDVMQVPTQSGRVFWPEDRPATNRVVVVNQQLADSVFDGRPIGKRIKLPVFEGEPWWEVVGVVGDERFDELDRDLRPVVYFPYQQNATPAFNVVVRTAADPATLGDSARAAISGVDSQVPIYLVQTMAQIVGESPPVFRRRAVLALMSLFAIAALGLAAIGLYGIVSQSVVERTREIGVRLTLGATRRDIAAAVVRSGLTPTLAGAVVGIAGSAIGARGLQALLFGLGAGGVAPMIAVAAMVLLATALVASLVPARRAMRVDPTEALRAD